MRKTKLWRFLSVALTAALLSSAAWVQAADEIVHDGEYYFLAAQYGEQWAKEDQEIDAKLAAIREKNGGKRPNILYVLIDDVSFGQMGKPGDELRHRH